MNDFEKILKGEKKDVGITDIDPVLQKHLKKLKSIKKVEKPSLTLVKRLEHRPAKNIILNFEGVTETPEPEYIDVYKCNKCGQTFNHPYAKIIAGVLPKCPRCD